MRVTERVDDGDVLLAAERLLEEIRGRASGDEDEVEVPEPGFDSFPREMGKRTNRISPSRTRQTSSGSR